jgi:hypothetical protein
MWLRQDQVTQDCNILVNWARVASTYGPPGANGRPTVPLTMVGGLRVPLADDQLAARRWTWVVEDLLAGPKAKRHDAGETVPTVKCGPREFNTAAGG